MNQLPDIQKLVKDFADRHDYSQNVWSEEMGMYLCPHVGVWIDDLLTGGWDTEALMAFAAINDVQLPELTRIALISLRAAELPKGWWELLSWAVRDDPSGKFIQMAIDALYLQVENRIFRKMISHDTSAKALAHLVEGTVAFEYAYIEATDSINYVPMGHVDKWWPQYMSIIDSLLDPTDLRLVSDSVGGISDTEACSSIPSADRLREIYETNGGHSAVVANPKLPADLVNANLDDCSLLFHPNADREQSWLVIQGILQNYSYEELIHYTSEWSNMRDDNWFQLSGFGTTSPQAIWLKRKISNWCDENISDNDEREEMLEMLGISEAEPYTF